MIESLYPSAPGHLLIIPKRHVKRVKDLNKAEYLDMHLLSYMHLNTTNDHYTIGYNDGKFAGQTVPHVHLHLIPRHEGDVEDPRGGIRWVLPSTANYLM
jgi:diadenosine tetraphosphate (Ap4A) HIT family hydrolase